MLGRHKRHATPERCSFDLIKLYEQFVEHVVLLHRKVVSKASAEVIKILLG